LNSSPSSVAEASAPASSANLGPGFDTLALALELRCRVRAEQAPEWSVEHLGPEQLNLGDRDIVLEAARRAAGSGGPLSLVVANEVPIGKGLGSSAAASSAGALAAGRAMRTGIDRDELFRLVTELEGHPDNAAAAVYGGLVGVSVDGHVIALGIDDGLRVVLAVPETRVGTIAARRVLPDRVERGVAVRSIARTVALVEGLRRGDGRLLAQAFGDELHEPYREKLSPGTKYLEQAAREAGAVYACRSGAGPSLLTLVTADVQERVEAALDRALDGRGRVMALEVAGTGVR
jgi:homoserine kinase